MAKNAAFLLDFLIMMPLLIEFPGIDKILPDAVEPTGDRRDGGHPSVAKPDEETVVLLAERLAGSEGVSPLQGLAFFRAGSPSDPSAHYELDQSAKELDYADHDDRPERYSAGNQRLGC